MYFACLIAACVIQFTQQQAISFDGDSTSAKDNECVSAHGIGSTCVDLRECPQAMDAINSGSQPTICGWTRLTPLVCCKRQSEMPNVDTCAPSVISRVSRRQTSLLLVTFTPPNVTTQAPATSVKPLVIGGVPSAEGSRPWMVAILEKGNSDRLSRLFCGGSLITARHVVTAAHCFLVRQDNAAFFEVTIGSNNISLGNVVDVSKIILHPDFREPSWYNDIAIVKLASEMSFTSDIRPICLPPPAFKQVKFASTQAFVAGWGLTELGGETSEYLQELALPTIPNPKCESIFLSLPGTKERYPRGINDQLLCAGHDVANKDACRGDSGGPLFWPDPLSGRWFLIGIVSSGFQCALAGIPAIYSRVTWHLDWIQENMK